jgi:hypothetical protein
MEIGPERAGQESPGRKPWEKRPGGLSPVRAAQAVSPLQGSAKRQLIPGLAPWAFLCRPCGAENLGQPVPAVQLQYPRVGNSSAKRGGTALSFAGSGCKPGCSRRGRN